MSNRDDVYQVYKNITTTTTSKEKEKDDDKLALLPFDIWSLFFHQLHLHVRSDIFRYYYRESVFMNDDGTMNWYVRPNCWHPSMTSLLSASSSNEKVGANIGQWITIDVPKSCQHIDSKTASRQKIANSITIKIILYIFNSFAPHCMMMDQKEKKLFSLFEKCLEEIEKISVFKVFKVEGKSTRKISIRHRQFRFEYNDQKKEEQVEQGKKLFIGFLTGQNIKNIVYTYRLFRQMVKMLMLTIGELETIFFSVDDSDSEKTRDKSRNEDFLNGLTTLGKHSALLKHTRSTLLSSYSTLNKDVVEIIIQYLLLGQEND
jgi:hypothetical protein